MGKFPPTVRLSFYFISLFFYFSQSQPLQNPFRCHFYYCYWWWCYYLHVPIWRCCRACGAQLNAYSSWEMSKIRRVNERECLDTIGEVEFLGKVTSTVLIFHTHHVLFGLYVRKVNRSNHKNFSRLPY